jgi:hypothetical protein
VDNAFGKLAVSFEANCGQCDGRAKYVARSRGASILVGATETTLARDGRSLRLELVGADGASRVSGLDRLPGVANYLVGNDPSRWRTHIPTYAGVRCEGVWPGVDAIYRGAAARLEFDFVVAPGGDPRTIELDVDGATSVTIDGDGTLVAKTGAGEVRERKPVVYQERADGTRRPVAGAFELRGGGRVGFRIGGYDRRLPLVVDPTSATRSRSAAPTATPIHWGSRSTPRATRTSWEARHRRACQR